MVSPPGRPVFPQPRLVGERVVLERHTLDRSAAMFASVDGNRERLDRWLPWVETTVTLDDERNYIRNCLQAWDDGSRFDYSILRRGDELFCGNCGTHRMNWSQGSAEIGYWIAQEHEGRGLVTEAVTLIETALFGLGIHRIEIRCDPENTRSQRIPERLGYVREGHLRQNIYRRGEWRDTVIYAKLAT